MAMAELPKARFSIGQVVRHRVFGYRGLIFDVDPFFSSSADWYEDAMAARHQDCGPQKNSPWYHVMVDGADHVIYVAERNLMVSEKSDDPIQHPLVPEFFTSRQPGQYSRRSPHN
ncbi:DNA-binding protein [Iodidimonas gelatinilytica]|uniref:Heat shock protein HspQ n=1 Tax=Iodidimonas gelatinilytica TaxID=1236966 RepID=A0A5A7MS28_9PROT|nr:heat shock protein HspQ [Iodidimonas gelatinilytica]GEQ98424.1 DNA-binding protein [Iodidimonas gelatinilytica]